MKFRIIQLPLLILALLFFIAPTSSGHDLMDVIASLKNIDKKLNEFEAVQKRDVQKLQSQLAMTGGTAGAPSMDTLKTTVTDLQNAGSKYVRLDSSLISLAGRFENLEREFVSSNQIHSRCGEESKSKTNEV